MTENTAAGPLAEPRARSKRGRKYGWRPSLPRKNVRVWRAPHRAADAPSSGDISAGMPTPFDQGQEGSCVDNCTCALVQYDQGQQGQQSVMPSRNYAYWWARSIEGTQSSDSGSTIADGISALAQYGWPAESDWPYGPATLFAPPPVALQKKAGSNDVTDYASVGQDGPTLKNLVDAGVPVVFGFVVYSSFEDIGQDGKVSLPGPEDAVLGGHANVIVGYDDQKGIFKTWNPWGTQFGDKGYLYFPESYVLDPQLAADFWILRTVPGDLPAPPAPPPAPPSPPSPEPGPAPAPPNISGRYLVTIDPADSAGLSGRKGLELGPAGPLVCAGLRALVSALCPAAALGEQPQGAQPPGKG